MPKRKWIVGSLAGLALFLLAGLAVIRRVDDLRTRTEVVFLNVGEGDAILLSQGENQVLVDGGRDGKDLLYRLGRHLPFWDRQIEAVIATHPDADHIGGLTALLRAYRVRNVLTTGAGSGTEAFRMLEAAIRERGVPTATVFAGASLDFPRGGQLDVLSPNRPVPREATETNLGSVVARFAYNDSSFLLTGDLPHEETHLVSVPATEILKIAHHGSKESSDAAFLDAVRPREAVISVGQNNYGHPDPGVLTRLAERGITVRRTDEHGDIVYRCEPDWSHCVFVP